MNKKSLVIVVTMFLSLFTTLKAQETPVVAPTESSFRWVEFGFKFMPTISSFSMKPASGGTVKGQATFGYGIGGSLGINFTRHYGIQGELLYNSLSQKFKDQDLDREINVRYINIPILFSANTGKDKQANFNVVLGPQFGMNIGSKVKSAKGENTDTVTYVMASKRSDFGIAYGAGLELMLNEIRTIRFDIGFRGVHGLTNINNKVASESPGSDEVYIVESAKVRTQSLYLGVSFLF